MVATLLGVGAAIGTSVAAAASAVGTAFATIGTAVAGSLGFTVGTAAAATGSFTTITSGTAAVIGAVSVAGAAAGIASGLIGGFSQYQTGNAQQAVYNFNADVAERNAALSRQEGEDRAAEQRRQTKRLIAQQNNAFGALGIVSGTGSALDLTSESAYFGELNALTLKYNKDLEAQNYELEAISLRMQGENAVARGRTSLATGLLKSTSTLITTGLGIGGAFGGLTNKISSGIARTSGGIAGDNITFA